MMKMEPNDDDRWRYISFSEDCFTSRPTLLLSTPNYNQTD